MILPQSLFVIVKPVGTKKAKNKEDVEIEKTVFQGIPESCLCANCHLSPNQREFLEMSYSGTWKEIDPNSPGNEHYHCTVCGYPITEREVGQ